MTEIDPAGKAHHPTAGEVGLHRQEPGTATPESAGPSLNVPRTQAPHKPYVKPVVSHGPSGDPLAGLSGPVGGTDTRPQTADVAEETAHPVHRSEEERLRDEIAQTREDLGRTVEALAGKADIKSRARETFERTRTKVAGAGNRARSQTAVAARRRAADVAERLRGAPVTTRRLGGRRLDGPDAAGDQDGTLAERVLAQAERHPTVLIAAGATTMAAAALTMLTRRNPPRARRR
ncbi:hypothetical protein GCM10009677_41440 [Sphaerisporangium rubeum]|uniref:DUF3618 domain-containing protein n=1 Tax=Sphaerisporangium rubeum TaxID=321317 RepID=A0A7X0M7T8_9ACTN|nr:DUF3618 domain-containing protein [Sphaerisporangium rubeum]MBB6473374.1 hypothetical protein [Sphaerisporangium rubeum]